MSHEALLRRTINSKIWITSIQVFLAPFVVTSGDATFTTPHAPPQDSTGSYCLVRACVWALGGLVGWYWRSDTYTYIHVYSTHTQHTGWQLRTRYQGGRHRESEVMCVHHIYVTHSIINTLVILQFHSFRPFTDAINFPAGGEKKNYIITFPIHFQYHLLNANCLYGGLIITQRVRQFIIMLLKQWHLSGPVPVSCQWASWLSGRLGRKVGRKVGIDSGATVDVAARTGTTHTCPQSSS